MWGNAAMTVFAMSGPVMSAATRLKQATFASIMLTISI